MHRQGPHRRIGLIAALLTLLGQLALGSLVPAAAAQLDALMAASICHADGSGTPAPHSRDHGDCPICPLCTTLTGQMAAPAPTPDVPRSHRVHPFRFAMSQPAHALPAPFIQAAQPRGPPRPI